MHATGDEDSNTSPYAHDAPQTHIFLVTRTVVQPMHMHWLKGFTAQDELRLLVRVFLKSHPTVSCPIAIPWPPCQSCSLSHFTGDGIGRTLRRSTGGCSHVRSRPDGCHTKALRDKATQRDQYQELDDSSGDGWRRRSNADIRKSSSTSSTREEEKLS